MTRRRAGSRFVFRNLGNERFGGQHQGADRRSVLQSGAGDLSRVNDAGFYQVFELSGGRVEAEVRVVPRPRTRASSVAW